MGTVHMPSSRPVERVSKIQYSRSSPSVTRLDLLLDIARACSPSRCPATRLSRSALTRPERSRGTRTMTQDLRSRMWHVL